MAKDVVVRFIGNASSVQRATRETRTGLESVEKQVHGTSKALTGLVSVGVLGGLAELSKAGLDERKSIGALQLQIEKATGARKVDMGATEAWINKMRDSSAFTDSVLRATYGRFINVLKDQKAAQDVTSFATDLARAKNIDLATATDALLGAETGRTKALVKLGVTVKDVHGKTLSLTDIMKVNKRAVEGAGEAYAQGAGKGELMKAKMHDLQEEVGSALVPVIDVLRGALAGVLGWFDKLSGSQKTAVIGIGLTVAAIGPMISVAGNLTTAIRGIGTALEFIASNPIILAIAALGLAVLVVWKHWKDFKAGLDIIWTGIKTTVKDGVNFLIDGLNLALDALLLPLRALSEIPGMPGRGAMKTALKMAHIPNFDDGGIMPGAIGAPGLAVLHGGEKVTPVGGAGDVIELHVHLDGVTKVVRKKLLKAKRNSLSLGLA